jgi:hypothetical protein
VNLQALIPVALKVSVLLMVFAIGLRASPRDATWDCAGRASALRSSAGMW